MEDREYTVEVLSTNKKGRFPLMVRTLGGRVGKHETTGDAFLTEEQAKAAVAPTVWMLIEEEHNIMIECTLEK